MKIRKFNEKKDDIGMGYIVEGKNHNLFKININFLKVYDIVIYMIVNAISKDIEENIINSKIEDFIDYIDKNMDFVIDTIDNEIQYVLDAFAMIFCEEKNFEKTKKNFYKIGYQLEELLIYLISKDVSKTLCAEFIKKMDL